MVYIYKLKILNIKKKKKKKKKKIIIKKIKNLKRNFGAAECFI
jgi:hypothetical protein